MKFNFPGELIEAAKAVSAAFGSAWYSVGADVGRDVGRVIRTIEAVVVNATRAEMSPSNAKVIAADTRNVTHAGTHVSAAETTDVAAAKTSHVASTEATHVTSAKAATMAAATAAAGLCARGSKAAGKQRSCQNHHQSSLHDLSPFGWAGIPPQNLRQPPARLNKANADVAMNWKMGIRIHHPY
jgi:hypothetical protein